ncbi:ABC transporter substrate-binding protein [Streptococcus henryi]|jgi:spermidine/putrescine transport system substrate-binding protein|uniref:ABC transporter substrate-binding protein n=1 Tax=Streptococcus henryi TaxID=439219 RepID=UPI00036E351F|nr:ABC transporter substrate-binding protein [Streptococcus henryi]
MRRLYSFIAGIVAIILILAGTSVYMQKRSSSGSQSDKLVIYNWGDYIDPDLLKKFTAETGIEVQYDTFDSNEAMYTKIKQGGTTYDIAVPSDYMIDKMIKEDLLVKLDKSKLKGMENIGEEFLGLSFDPDNEYSIPYFWGTVGIVYNETMVEQAPEHWIDLWREEYRNDIMLVDGAREVMGFGLNTLGYSLNSKKLEQLQEVELKLHDLTPNIKAIVGDEMKGYMIQGDAAIGVTFSGEASEMLDSNEDLHYVVPSEGSNLWFDNLVIPKTVKHEEEVYAFFNFMLEPENAAQNAEYIGYSTPNEVAKELLPDDVKNDPAFYPSQETIENLEVYDNLGEKWLGIYNDLYLQFKMYRK